MSDTLLLDPNEYALFLCPNDGLVQKVIQNRQSSGVTLSNVKCRRCQTQMELCTPESVGWRSDVDGLHSIKEVTADNVLARQYYNQQEDEKLRWYWRLSPLWKAIDKHICNSNPGECYVFEKRWPIQGSSASSGVSINKVYAFPAGSADEHWYEVRFCFSVTMWNDDWEREEEGTGMVDVPAYLVRDFKQDTFDQWLAVRKEKHQKQTRQKMVDAVRGMVKRFPDLRPQFEKNPEIAAMLKEEE